MVVASGTGERETQQRLADHVDLVVNNIADEFFLVRAAMLPKSDGKHRRRDHPLGIKRFAIRVRQQVAGDLVHDELIVRHISVQHVDDPITIAVGLVEFE